MIRPLADLPTFDHRGHNGMRDKRDGRLDVIKRGRRRQNDWKAAREAAVKLARLLTEGAEQRGQNHSFSNAYLPIAFFRCRKLINTLTSGMECVRLVFEGKSNAEIKDATGLSTGTIAAYKAWNTMYSQNIKLAIRVKAAMRQVSRRKRSRGYRHV
jgi:hypothetical protein